MATTKNIQSVERAFSILEMFQQSNHSEHSVKEISVFLGLNKSTTFGLINTLTNLGYLQQNSENQKYALSLKLLSFSNTIKLQNIIIRTVHPYLERLTNRYGETAHCAIGHNDGVIYIDKVETTGSIYLSTQIGTRNDLHCTGVGKCILAYLPPEQQELIFSKSLATKTYYTITNSERLREEIRNVSQKGYALDREEFSIGLSCVAVPVFSAPGEIACAISVSGMNSRIQMAIDKGLLLDLKQTAADISKTMFGYDCPVDLSPDAAHFSILN